MSAADMELAVAPSPTNYPDYICPQEDYRDTRNLVFATVFVVMGVLGLVLLHALGTLRRRSSHKALHAVLSGAYMLSYPLVSYTLGIMSTSNYYFDVFPVWAVSLLMLIGGTDNLMACKLNDVENWKSFHVKHLYQAGLVVYIVAAYSHFAPEYRNPVWAILCVNLLQSFVRIKSMRMANKSQLLSKNVKPIADYMEHDKEKKLDLNSSKRPNPLNLEGYGYVVGGEHELENYLKKYAVSRDTKVEDFKITTVENIWQCKGSLLASDRGSRLKDVCLSMALAKMLNRRFAGVKLAEADLEETKDFVFQGLIGDDKSYERAFRVIEVELGFVYDLYYTRYPYLYHKVRYLALCLPLAMVILCSWLTYMLFKKYTEEQDGRDCPLITTMGLMVVVTLLEAFQLCLHINSGWFKVALIQSYVTRTDMRSSSCFPNRIIGLVLRLEVLRPWANRLGQYSLLESYDNNSGPTNFLHYVTLSLVDKAKMGRKKEKLVKLSEQMKRAVIESLVESNGHLTNGVRSLRKNGVHEQLSWACYGPNVTHTILVWHIATAICKNQLDAAMPKKHSGLFKVASCMFEYCAHICGCTNKLDAPMELSEKDRTTIATASEVASSLSQYCAYLLAFAPELLPDHSFDSTSILDKSIQLLASPSLSPSLMGAKTLVAKCKEVLRLGDTGNDDTPIVVQGARLARQLMKEIQDVPLRWRVLSDFWSEMMLYVAPGEDAQARAHLEALARGGEFITHLWALLTHAGVLERDHVGPLSTV